METGRRRETDLFVCEMVGLQPLEEDLLQRHGGAVQGVGERVGLGIETHRVPDQAEEHAGLLLQLGDIESHLSRHCALRPAVKVCAHELCDGPN